MKAGFPKNKYKLHDPIEAKPLDERVANLKRSRTAMFCNRIVKWRKKKGYGFKRFMGKN